MFDTYDKTKALAKHMKGRIRNQDARTPMDLCVPDKEVEALRAGVNASHAYVTAYQAEQLRKAPSGTDANSVLPARINNPDKPFVGSPASLEFSTSWNNMKFTRGMTFPTMKCVVWAQEMSAFSDLPFRECYRMVMSWYQQEYDFTPFVRDFFTAKNYATQGRKRIFVDVETTGTHPSKGEIIETGFVVTDAAGNTLDEYIGLYDTSCDIARIANHVPLNHVHNIKVSEIVGKPPVAVRDPKTHAQVVTDKKLLELICDHQAVLVAHNSNFEGQWFMGLSKDFWDLRSPFSESFNKNPEVLGSFQDTKFICALGVPTSGNRLKDFVEYFGGVYEGAHRALQDAIMTKDAYFAYINSTRDA
jgi:hypothetical protein